MLTPSYTPQQAVNLVSQFVHGAPLAGVEANICDTINSWMWTYYPWSWTIASLTPISMIDGVQDYRPTNQDILRILKVRLVRTDVVPMEARELAMLSDLGVELTRKGGIDANTAFGYFASTNVLRMLLAASVGASQSIQIQGEYVKAPTRITDSTLDTPFAFPDQMFLVFIEGIKYLIYKLTDDPRAGSIQLIKNGRYEQVFSGQLGLFMHQLNYAARNENLSTGDQFQYPESGLGQRQNFWPGLLGM